MKSHLVEMLNKAIIIIIIIIINNCAAKCLKFMLSYVRVAPATADIQIILKVQASDKIHIEPETMVLPD